MDNRGIDTDPGWINRQLRELRQAIEAMRSERRAGSAWDGNHLTLGSFHLWVDATGDLRIKSSAPASDLDGAVVGAQS